MSDDLTHWRKEFPILSETTYMISNSLGAMPRGTRDTLREYADTWAARGVRAWHEGWWEMPLTLGDSLCEILGAPKGSVTTQPNVSLSHSIVFSCFDYEARRNKIVSTEMNFPSIVYVLNEQRRRGARLDLVPSDDGITVDRERFLNAIDEETLIVSVSHVLFRSAFIQDAAAIAERAYSVGAKVILDVYQSAGCVPLDVSGWNVDFAVGGCLKWLCGGPGTAFLYVRPDLAPQLHPVITGWQAHARPFEFKIGPMEWGDPRFRMLNGTPVIPALYAAREGLRIINEVGVERIRQRSQRLTGLLLEEAAAAGISATCPSRPEVRGGTVALNAAGGELVTEKLLERDVLVDYRPRAGIRVSPHFYSTEDECRRVVSEIVRIQKDLGLR